MEIISPQKDQKEQKDSQDKRSEGKKSQKGSNRYQLVTVQTTIKEEPIEKEVKIERKVETKPPAKAPAYNDALINDLLGFGKPKRRQVVEEKPVAAEVPAVVQPVKKDLFLEEVKQTNAVIRQQKDGRK